MPLELSQVLTLKPTLRIEYIDAGAAVLLGERERYLLSGIAAISVARLADGVRTVEAIIAAARDRVSEPEALYTLGQLAAQGHLVSATPALTPEAAAFWHAMGIAGGTASRLTPVAVRAIGEIPASWMTESLVQTGIVVDRDAPTQVVVTDDYLRPELAELDRQARERRTRWVLIKPTGVQPLLGPDFDPGSGPCWDCLAFWIRQNQPVEELVRRRRASMGDDAALRAPVATVEASARTVCGLGALAIARALAGAASLRGRLCALDMTSLATTAHAVVHRPQCSSCGDPRLMTLVGQRPIELAAIAKAHFEDGGYRRHNPRRTYERYHHLVSPITGAVTHLVAMPERDTELRAVYASGYLVCPRGSMPKSNVFDRPCAGKGRSADQARVSALCEALERYSGVYQGDEARTHGSTRELGSAAVQLDDLLQFSEAQYHGRTAHHTDLLDRRHAIPEPLGLDTRIDWTPGWSLTHQARRYVPLAYCYAEPPPEAGIAYCGPCGNGVAAGTCLEEAILQGILELVERDAAAIWWYNRLPRPAIDLASFADPYFDALIADYARLGWSIWVLDLTHDLGIPACVALAKDAGTERFAIGFGCHLEPRLAVQRSLTELNQLFDPAGAGLAPWNPARLPDREFLVPDPGRSPIAAAAMPRFSGADLRADIAHAAHRLEAAGLELVVVDKTRPDIGLHVAQVIVPGLRHFWPRFAPGRLYQVPPALGWRARPLDEAELNPVPLFV